MRAALAVVSGRAAGALSRRLRLGGGTSIVGLVAQRIYPDIIRHLATQLEHGSVLVTGTNGKTTTSGFLAAILRDAGLRVWRNREGANLLRGVAGALVVRALPNGNLRRSGQAISVLEIDEAVMPQAVRLLEPRAAVFVNLFRDQLDRYGEVESVASLWRQTVKGLPETTTLVLNADDPTTASLGELARGPVLYFGLEDLTLDVSGQDGRGSPGTYQAVDSRSCVRCGSDYHYSARFYSHMGHYQCPHCGLARPSPSVRALQVRQDGFDRLRVMVETPTQQGEIVIPLPGLYNVYNALAAIAAAQALGISWEPIVSGIEQFKPAFGRGERVQVAGRTLRLLLAKNPTGLNEVLRTLFSEGTPRHVLFVLNDNIADGRDVSWIWDVDFERARGLTASLTVSGTRAFDLALRLKYAGFAPEEMMVIPSIPLRTLQELAGSQTKGRRSRARARRQPSPRQGAGRAASFAVEEQTAGQQTQTPLSPGHGLATALEQAIEQTPVGETLFIVPTYTGLLELHRELERRGLTPHYWEGRE
ncbi:MurT ligase domain-containing protein [Thermogemmatispora sp.]|uniref:Mur ligase family protein n=1 Tax=Thermogemmatispora sp. TaxID=1968838 RepID=UPI0035E42BCB